MRLNLSEPIPRWILYLSRESPHPIDEIGCTGCHGGRGRATTFNRVVHTPRDDAQKAEWEETYGWAEDHHWDGPMYPADFSESGCLKCHSDTVNIPRADLFNRGRSLYEKAGCWGCHNSRGFEERRNDRARSSTHHLQDDARMGGPLGEESRRASSPRPSCRASGISRTTSIAMSGFEERHRSGGDRRLRLRAGGANRVRIRSQRERGARAGARAVGGLSRLPHHGRGGGGPGPLAASSRPQLGGSRKQGEPRVLCSTGPRTPSTIGRRPSCRTCG